MSERASGVVVVDKPVGVTSFTVVRRVRAATGWRKVGHGGTLDPLASGVLPICFGEATKLAQFLLDADKEYDASISFGVETDTYDAGGTVMARFPAGGLDRDHVVRALAAFVGEQQQLPPMYSALKREGRPLYTYAREGRTIERLPRRIRIHALELTAFTPGSAEAGPAAAVHVHCSKGTYIRSLAYDLGRTLGTGAHLAALRRTRSGPFGIEQAVELESAAQLARLVSPADALAHLIAVTASDGDAVLLRQGRRVPWRSLALSAGTYDAPVRILGAGGDLVAVARPPSGGDAETVHTLRVFGARPLR